MKRSSLLAGLQRIRSSAATVWRYAALPVMAIVLALAIAAVVIVVSSAFTGDGFQPLLPLSAYQALIVGAFGNENALLNTLVDSAPLMFGGLAVGLGFKDGLFNIVVTSRRALARTRWSPRSC